jgi:hypothetical protein
VNRTPSTDVEESIHGGRKFHATKLVAAMTGARRSVLPFVLRFECVLTSPAVFRARFPKFLYLLTLSCAQLKNANVNSGVIKLLFDFSSLVIGSTPIPTTGPSPDTETMILFHVVHTVTVLASGLVQDAPLTYAPFPCLWCAQYQRTYIRTIHRG